MYNIYNIDCVIFKKIEIQQYHSIIVNFPQLNNSQSIYSFVPNSQSIRKYGY